MNSATISSSWLSDGSRGASGAGSLTFDFVMSSLRFPEPGRAAPLHDSDLSRRTVTDRNHDRHQSPHGAAVGPARPFAGRAETMADLAEGQVHEIFPAHDLTFAFGQFLHGLLDS